MSIIAGRDTIQLHPNRRFDLRHPRLKPVEEPSGSLGLLGVAVQHDIAGSLAQDVRLGERMHDRVRALCGFRQLVARGEQFQNRRIISRRHSDA